MKANPVKTIDDLLPGENTNALYLADKEDMWELQQKLRPDLTHDDFEKAWKEFIRLKQRKTLN